MSNDTLYFSVIGIEYGVTKISNMCVLGTFSTIEKAQKFIEKKEYPAIYSLIDIVETKLDSKYDPDIENKLYI